MESHKLQLKFFCKDGYPGAERESALEPLIGVFQAWIRDKKVPDEVLVDAADYTHVPDGPGVLLVGHGVDYYLDEGAGGSAGLMISRKRAFDGDFSARLRDGFARLVAACGWLEEDKALSDALRFRTDEFLLRIPDRLHAPNTDATVDLLREQLAAVVAELYGAPPKKMVREGSERDLFTLRVQAPDGKGLSDLKVP